MVQYRDLNAPPARALAEIVADMRAAERQSKTGDAGVKDLGEAGDVVWPRPDGTPVSVRDVDLELEDARSRIGEAEESLVQTGDRLEAAEGAVAGVAGDLSRVETVVIPGAVADLEVADQANAQAVADAESRSDQARADLAAQIDRDIEDAATALSSDINSVRTSVDGKSKITQSLDAPPAQYAGAVGDRWERMSSMGSGGRLVSNWRWNGSVWVSTLIGDAVIGNLDAAKITSGFIDASRIKAGSISADKMLIGGSENYLPMSGVDAGAGIAPHAALGGRTADLLSNETVGREYVNAIWIRGQESGTLGVWQDAFEFNSGGLSFPALGGKAYPVKVGQPFRAGSYIIRRGSEPDGRVLARLVLAWYRFDGTEIGRTVGTEGGGVYTPDSEISVSGYAPPGVSYLRVIVQTDRRGDVVLWRTRLIEQKESVLIADGAVTADKVAANAVTAGKIAAGAIEADKIAAGAITIGKVGGLQGALDGKETPAGAQTKADAAKSAAQQAAAAEYGETKTLVGGWRKTGQTTIAGGAITTDSITAGHLKSGAVTTAKLAVTEDMSAAIVNAMSVNTKKLVVTQETILNHATLIGQTVVDDINVQGKLIGTDGVFTGTVDFENVNVTNEVLASKISGEHLYGTIVEGGEFRTTEGLSSGQFIISDNAFVFPDGLTTTPGLRFEDPSSDLVQPAGIGTWNGDLRLSGGRSSDGGDATVTVEPTGFRVHANAGSTHNDVYDATMTATVSGVSLGLGSPGSGHEAYQVRVEPPLIFDGVEEFGGSVDLRASRGSLTGRVEVYEDHASMRTTSSGDTVAEVRADDREAYLWSTGADGLGRVLSVDSDGIWVKKERSDGSGQWDHYNLELTANDSGWISLPLNSAVTGAGSPAYRIKNNVVYFRGTLTLPGANWSSGWTTLAAVTDAAHKPSFGIQRAGASSVIAGIVLQVNTAGTFEMYLPQSVPGSTTIQLSPMFYPIG